VSARIARESIEAARSTLEALEADGALLERVVALADRIFAAVTSGGRVWLFGNGGSAADAQHLAAELVGRFRLDRSALPAEALTVNASVLTALANDFGFNEVFARQLEAHGRSGDVAIGITTSGESENVVRGLERARALGLHTVALTGRIGSRACDVASECIAVPADDTPRIQECHILLGHVLCELVERQVSEAP
jgi:D-sedoheptulose 7-phosphate isomerase